MSSPRFRVEYPGPDPTSKRPQACGTSGKVWVSALCADEILPTVSAGSAVRNGVLRLRPVNSLGRVSPSCYIDLPMERKVVRDLIAQLQQLEASLP